MKLFNFLKDHKIGFLSFALVVLAAALGADSSFAMAMADGAEGVQFEAGNAAAPATEPDAKGFETVQDGAATETKARATGFEQEEIDKVIAQYDLFNFALNWYIVNMARQVSVKTYTPKHFRNSSARLDLELTSTKTLNRDTVNDVYDLTIAKSTDVKDNFMALKTYSTVYFIMTPGFKTGTPTAVRKGFLYGYIINSNANSCTIRIMNADPTKTQLVIAEGTKMIVGATACSETQMIVPPDNYQPVKVQIQLQKKNSNIVWSKEWEETAKEVEFVKEDLRNNALWLFKYKCAVTHWLGGEAVGNIYVGGDLDNEDVFFEEGLINQVNMYYAYQDDNLTPEDFNAIAKLQFTKFSKNRHAVVFAGANFLEKQQNMDVSKVQTLKLGKVEVTGGLIVKRWESIFGDMDFVYDPIFSEIGFSDFAFVCDIKEVTRYVKREQKKDTLDLSKTGEAREAKREIFSIIDAIALRGYNSILVGPSSQIALVQGFGAMEDVIVRYGEGEGQTSLPANPGAGTVYFLEADVTDANGKVWPKDSIIEFDAANNTWAKYHGAL